MQNINHSLILA